MIFASRLGKSIDDVPQVASMYMLTAALSSSTRSIGWEGGSEQGTALNLAQTIDQACLTR